MNEKINVININKKIFLKSEDVQNAFKKISEMLSEEDFSDLENVLNKKNIFFRCELCFDEGSFTAFDFKNFEYRFKCRCSAGNLLPQAWPIYQNNDVNHFTLSKYAKRNEICYKNTPNNVFNFNEYKH